MKKNILKTFSSVFIITLIAKVLGLLRDSLFANYYGTGVEATAFFTAIKIPTQIVDLVLSSAIVSTFVPVFNEVLQKEGKDKANLFANHFVNGIAMIATLLTLVGIVFARPIVKLLAGGFDTATYELTVELIRIAFPMIIFTAMAFSFVGLLQSYGQFNVPAMISGISNLVVIGFLLLFRERTGIQGVTVCMVVAWFLQLVIQFPFAKKFGYPFSFTVCLKDANLKKVFRLAVPIIMSTAVLPINNLVSTRIASDMSDGAMAALEYAYKLYIVVSGVFTYAIGNIIFPELSRAIADGNKENYQRTIQKALKLLTFLLIPLTAGIMIYSQDMVSIMYERGEFGMDSVVKTADALFFYAIGIIGAGFVEVMNKSFYARQDTKTPFKVGLVVVVCNFIVSLLLSHTALEFRGLALATSLTAILNAVLLLVLVSRQEKGIWNRELLEYLLKIGISAGVMTIIVCMGNSFLVPYLHGGMVQNIIRVGLGAFAGVVVYFVCTALFKINIIKELQKGKEAVENR